MAASPAGECKIRGRKKLWVVRNELEIRLPGIVAPARSVTAKPGAERARMCWETQCNIDRSREYVAGNKDGSKLRTRYF